MKKIFFFCLGLLFLCPFKTQAQVDGRAFLDYQLTFPRVNQAYYKLYPLVNEELRKTGFKGPLEDMYIRSFKLENELEIWVKDRGVDTYALFRRYNVCTSSGVLGPKRQEGDLQVPEGLYFITYFNPTSTYYLSLLVSYPNYSDRIKGHKETPGGDIYVHGGCATVGCLPMRDEFIKEIYVMCLMARTNGQTNIPIHIFPARFTAESLDYLYKNFEDEGKHRFWANLKSGYDYFERTHKILPVMYSQDGKYVF